MHKRIDPVTHQALRTLLKAQIQDIATLLDAKIDAPKPIALNDWKDLVKDYAFGLGVFAFGGSQAHFPERWGGYGQMTFIACTLIFIGIMLSGLSAYEFASRFCQSKKPIALKILVCLLLLATILPFVMTAKAIGWDNRHMANVPSLAMPHASPLPESPETRAQSHATHPPSAH